MLKRSPTDESSTVPSAAVSSPNGSDGRPPLEPTPDQEPVVSPATHDDYYHAPRVSLLTIGLFCVVLIGLLLRYSASQQLSSHVDESASIMAAEMVVEKGVPVFPSGTLYLQGATISYLLAPAIALGYGGIDHLTELRLLSVIAGTLAILALYFLTTSLTRSAWTGLAVAALLAIDPASVRWGGLVRMYALLQLVSLVMLALFIHLLRTPASRRAFIGFVVVFWLGVFTHIAICLFLPPMLILAAWKHRLALFGRRLDLLAALGAACAAPFTLLVLNRLVTPPQATPVGESTPGISFVGEYLLSIEQILNPTLSSWQQLFRYADPGGLIPVVLVGLSCLLFGRYYLDSNLAPHKVERRNILSALLLLYWVPILLVASFATEHNERYLLHLHPLGLILIGFAAQDLIWKERALPAPAFTRAPGTATLLAGGTIVVWGDRLSPRLAWATRARVISAVGVTLIAIGAALRLIGYNRLSMWLDEGFSLLYSKQEWASAAGLNGFYSPHPPLYFLSTKIFNLVLPDVWAGRTLSVLCGVLALPVFFLLARRLLDPVAAVIATGVFALSPIHIYYSQEARMYSMVVLSVTASFLALIAFEQSRRLGWAALYGVSLAVAVWADYSSLFVLAPQALVLAVFVWRDWRKMLPLVAAGGIAVLAYLPWLPQVWASVNSANEEERREDYLGAGLARVLTISLRLTGIGADRHGAYFPSLDDTPWDSLPELQPFILIAMAPVVALGVAGLWRRWRAAAVTFCFLGCIAVAVLASLISPGFAERTILSAAVGWSLLLGAAFNGRAHRQRTPLAAASLLVILVLCLGTIQNIHASAVKQRWDDASADLAMVSPVQYPVITYSYGAVADTLIEAYEPGLIDDLRLITIRDGVLEGTLSNDTIPKKGITAADVDAGMLNELLPVAPENDLVWFFYAQRVRLENVRQGIEGAGYTRTMNKVYDAPRGLVFFDLYARPGADVGEAVAGMPPFATGPDWGIPTESTSVVPSADGRSVSITNSAPLGTAVATQVEQAGGAIYTVDVDVTTRLTGSDAVVTLSCLTSTGVPLETQSAGTAGEAEGGTRHHRSAVVCPHETEQLRITLTNEGIGEMTYANLVVSRTPIPKR